MQLTSLNISFDDYGVHKGKYKGSAHFRGQYGAVEIVLTPDISDQVLKLCAEAIVANTKELAQTITAATLTQVSGNVLEHKA